MAFKGAFIPLPDGQFKFIQESCTFATFLLHRALKMESERDINVISLIPVILIVRWNNYNVECDEESTIL